MLTDKSGAGLTGRAGVVTLHTMRRTHLHLTDPQLARLRLLADRSGLNVAELVRRAVDDFLGRGDGDGAVLRPGPMPAGPARRRTHEQMPPEED